MVLVEEQAHRHAALQSAVEGAEQRVPWSVLEPQVVNGDVQRRRGGVEEGGDPLRDGVCVLTAVGQEEEVERRGGGYSGSALPSPVCSRGF
jgi:hypothetical protein